MAEIERCGKDKKRMLIKIVDNACIECWRSHNPKQIIKL